MSYFSSLCPATTPAASWSSVPRCHNPYEDASFHADQLLPLAANRPTGWTTTQQTSTVPTFVTYPSLMEIIRGALLGTLVKPLPNEEVVKVFIGQMPFSISEELVAWICTYFKVPVFSVRAILKRDGTRRPTGGFHVTTTREGMNTLLATLHKHVLVDVYGFWLAQTVEQVALLNQYLMILTQKRGTYAYAIPCHLPYRTVSVEEPEEIVPSPVRRRATR